MTGLLGWFFCGTRLNHSDSSGSIIPQNRGVGTAGASGRAAGAGAAIICAANK